MSSQSEHTMCERMHCQPEMIIILHCLIGPLKMLQEKEKYGYSPVLGAP